MGISRRILLTNLGYSLFLTAAAASAAWFARILTPNLVATAPASTEVGPPEDFLSGALTFVANAKSYVGHDEQGYYAIIAICPHLGCTPRPEGNEFACPCHGSRFSREGHVINSPASRGLDHAYIGRAQSGNLFVDRGPVVDKDYRLQF
jgi:cytochrome b6-f complex iron-sulfur subunit